MVDALVSLIAVDRSLAHAVWTAARDAVAGSLQSSQRSDCRLFQFALLATADHAIGEELFQMIDAGEVCNRIAREEALEYLAHSLAFMRQEKLPQLARAFSEHIPMSEVARRLSAVEDTRGVFCSFTSFSRGEVRAICEHLDIEAMARSIVLEGVDDYIVEGIRALQRSSHSTAGRLIAAIEDKDVRQEIRARVSKV